MEPSEQRKRTIAAVEAACRGLVEAAARMTALGVDTRMLAEHLADLQMALKALYALDGVADRAAAGAGHRN